MTDPGKPDARLDDDDIEILEVIGLDDDSPAAQPKRPADEPREAVVQLEEGQAPPAVAPEPAKPAADNELALRLAADFEGLQRRVEREREASERHAAARLIARLLPVLDNFERAIGASGSSVGAGFRDGIALIFRQLLEELRKEGLVAVDSVGEPFDPRLHEAVATTHDPDLPSHTIVEELQRGYLLHQRLLRPALVRVTVDPEPQDGAARENGER